MDQLKDFLRQCVKYRFWIAFGVSLLLPMIGYFVGSGAIKAETTKQEAAIKVAKTDVSKYSSGSVINAQYKPEADKKKAVLDQDVDATWRKLFTVQEPLLKWPSEVEEKFRKWGRKYPAEVDANQVQATIVDYVIAYPEFVSRIYKIFKPFNFDDGSGIVVAPEMNALLTPAPFSQDAPPDLGKVWSEQERIWVVTALLDVIGKVNDSVGAKDWDGAIIKQIIAVEVGSPADQDQMSMVKGAELVPAETLAPEGTAAPAAPVAEAGPGGGVPGGQMPPGMMGGAGGKTEGVYYLKTEGQQYKILPIKMTVLVDQAHLQDFLVGLENSPMAIQVMEPEIAKPLTPVVKPVYGERSSYGMMGYGGMGEGPGGMGMNMRGMMGPGMSSRQMGEMMGGSGRMQQSGMMQGMMPGMMEGRGMGSPAVAKKGIDNRSKNQAAERKAKEKEASKAKAEPKKPVDQYYNVIEVTVYGQARFYLAPPVPAESQPSTASAPDAPKTEAAQPQPTPAAEALNKEGAAKDVEAPKAETPKPDAAPKGDEPKAEPSTPKAGDPAPKR